MIYNIAGTCSYLFGGYYGWISTVLAGIKYCLGTTCCCHTHPIFPSAQPEGGAPSPKAKGMDCALLFGWKGGLGLGAAPGTATREKMHLEVPGTLFERKKDEINARFKTCSFWKNAREQKLHTARNQQHTFPECAPKNYSLTHKVLMCLKGVPFFRMWHEKQVMHFFVLEWRSRYTDRIWQIGPDRYRIE